MSASASFFPRLHSLYKEVDQTRRQPPAWTILNQMIEEMGREIKHIEQDHPCLSDGRRTIALIPEEQYVHHWKEDELHIDRKISCFYLLFQGRMGMGLDKNHCCQEGDLIFSYQGKEYRFPSDMSQRIQSFLNTNWTSSHRCAEFMASSTGAFTFSYEKVSDLQSQAFAPGTALLLTQKNTIMHFGLYIGEDLVLSKLGKNEIVITTLAELHRLYETDTVYQLEPAEKTDQDVTYGQIRLHAKPSVKHVSSLHFTNSSFYCLNITRSLGGFAYSTMNSATEVVMSTMDQSGRSIDMSYDGPFHPDCSSPLGTGLAEFVEREICMGYEHNEKCPVVITVTFGPAFRDK